MMKLKWEQNNSRTNNPVISKISGYKDKGLPRQKIIEKLLQEGIPFRNIKKAYQQMSNQKKPLDWRSPTSINETARQIRKDIRRKRVSYFMGMKILIRAKNMLRTIVKNPQKDRRLSQIQYEINTTKKLLMPQYANPETIREYKLA